MSLCVFCKGSFLIAFCRILCYSIIAAQQQQALCCKMQVVKLPPGVKSGGVQFFVILRTVRMFLHQRPKGGVHYGCVEYCFQCAESSGYGHHRCHSGDMDDLQGCLSGQTPRKTLFLQQKRLTAKMLPQATVNLF